MTNSQFPMIEKARDASLSLPSTLWMGAKIGRFTAVSFSWIAVLAIGVFLLLGGMASAAGLADRVFEATLANGLKVLLVEEPKAPVVSIQVRYKVGSRNEPIGKSGISHMLEHMMFKGTPTIGSKQFSLTVQRNGGVDNAHTTAD